MSFYKSYIQYSKPTYRAASPVRSLLSNNKSSVNSPSFSKRNNAYCSGREFSILRKLKSHSFVFNLIIVVLILLTAAFYLLQTNNLAVASFQIKELETNIQKLNYFNRELEEEITRLQSMDELSKSAASLHMVSINRIDYLKPPSEHILAIK